MNSSSFRIALTSNDLQIFDHFPNSLFVIDNYGTIYYSNSYVAEQFGFEIGDIANSSLEQLIIEQDRASFRHVLQLMTQNQPISDVPLKMINRSKEIKSWLLKITSAGISENATPLFFVYCTDLKQRDIILELQEKESAFLEESKMLSKIIEQNPYAIALWDPDGYFLHGNPAYFRLWMDEPPEDYCLFTDPVLIENGLDAQIHDLNSQNKQIISLPLLYKDKWVRITLFPVFNRSGELLNLVSMYEDVSFQHKIDTFLTTRVIQTNRTNQDNFSLMNDISLIFELNPLGIALFDVQGYFKNANKAFRQLFLIPLNSNIPFFKHPIFAKYNLLEKINPAIHGEVVNIPELKVNLSDISDTFPNMEKIFHIMIFPLFSAENQVVNIIIMIDDITIYREAALVLEEKNSLYRSFYENTAIGMGIITPEGKIIDLNPTMQKILGDTLNRARALDVRQYYAHPSDEQEINRLLEVEHKVSYYELELHNIHHQPYWAIISIHPIIYRNQNCLLLTQLDITKRKTTEQALIEREEQIQYEKAISMISSFLILYPQQNQTQIAEILHLLHQSVSSNAIFIFQNQKIHPKLDLRLKGYWAGIPGFEEERNHILSIFQSNMIEMLKPMGQGDMHFILHARQFQASYQSHLNRLQFNTLLFIPLYIGKDLFGTMVVTHSDPTYAYSSKEISACANIAILLGFSFKAQQQQESFSELLNALNTLHIGIFILQVDQHEKTRFRFVNQEFSRLVDTPPEDLIEKGYYLDYIAEEDRDALQSIIGKEPRSSPFSFRIRYKVHEELREFMVRFLYDASSQSTYGIVLLNHMADVPTIQDIAKQMKKKRTKRV